MPQQRVYYDLVNDEMVPYWYVLTFQTGELDWNKPIFYFEVYSPFEFIGRDDFDDSIISTTILLSDLVVQSNTPSQIGINLTSLKKRLSIYNVDCDLVRQFVLTMPDVEEILSLIPNKRTMKFVLGAN
ncbi:hypothetical protein ACFSO7_02735 [Bacillus sp. CGMCC 1.16607]|uniref:hypothetical protein n=1 Tax=Bacillus sp. CGMCC 1.16607 TaxID=3351842 RepID=UPI003644F63C